MGKHKTMFDEIKGGVGISSMYKVTSGEFCGKYGKGSAMVQIGGYAADPYKGDMKAIMDFLKPDIKAARKSGAKVAMNTLALNLDYLVEFVRGFEEADGDFVEYNAHTPSEAYVNNGMGYMHFAPENQPSLFEYTEKMADALSIPLIIKGRAWSWKSGSKPLKRVAEDYVELSKKLMDLGADAIHLNIRKEDEKRYDLDILKELKDRLDIFLIASGYVGLTPEGAVDLDKAVSDTKAILSAGADLVLIGEAVMKDNTIVERLAEKLS
jgi:tRNA-dihydrouridine synthase